MLLLCYFNGLLLTITAFTTKEIYSKIVVTITNFYVKVTHLFIHKKLKCHKKHYKVYNTNLTYIGINFFKVNLCSVLSISSSIYKHYI